MTEGHSPLVSDYMEAAKPLLAGSSLQQTIRHLLYNNLTGVPVVDAESQVIGFVSEQDCIRQALNGSYHCEFNSIVEDVMSHNVMTVNTEDTIIAVAQSMADDKLKTYPVIKDNKLAGVIPHRAILHALAYEMEHLRSVM